jgi:hypothetical protein
MVSFARFIAVLAVCVVLDAWAPSCGAAVWVFGEPNFPRSGSAAGLSARGITAALRQNGIEAGTLDAKGLESASLLEDAGASVLVLPCGNVFPEGAFANLREFHRRGGSFVLTGVPFTHPCARVGGKWRDLGHRSFFAHGLEGAGTGGFRSAPSGRRRKMRVAENPLKIPREWFEGVEGPTQWLDTASLDPADEVVPLLVGDGEGAGREPFAACIRHRCGAFPGACDVWLGHIVGGEEERDVFLASQLLTRGVIWCLLEKGLLGAERFQTALAGLDARHPPGPLPEGLRAEESPMPWGSSFVPKSRPPARALSVVDLGGLSAAARVAVTCLQGLTCRTEPGIWVIHAEPDRFWLEWHRQQGHIDGWHEEKNWEALFAKHRESVKGAVIPDPSLYRGDLLAVNVAACEDWIVASPELAEALGLPVRLDLRGRFKTYAEGLDWLWDNYKDRLSRHVCDYMHPGRLTRGNFAYAYQWRAPMLWIAGREEEDFPGVDRAAEKRAVARVFSEMPVNIPIFGFPAAGEGGGIGEPPGVALASRYGKGLVCTDHMPNAGVMSGVRIAHLQQPGQPPVPVLLRDKIYVALAMSDGDNQNAWHLFFRRYFESPVHGKFPLAFGMGPAILELQPAVAQWYYAHATPTTEFIADVSGASYMQPDHWGEAYTNRAEVLSGFLKWTAKLLPPLGMRTVRTVHGEDAFLSEYAKALPFCHSLFADMGCYSGHSGYGNLTYALPEGMPVFRAVTTWRNFGTGFLGEIREQVGTQRPAFVNGFVHCWTFQPADVERIVSEAGPDFVFVTPSQLAALYKQAGGAEKAAPSARPATGR